jgi:signal transduction histidine kinase
VLKLYRSRITTAGIKVQRDVGDSGNAPTVLSTPGELRQVLANLVGNAIDAMRTGGRLRIRVSEHRSAAYHRPFVRLTIADTGTGIPADVRPTIFEPFVTTKGETGTGLGLWVTSEIIKRNRWAIRVHTSRKLGATGTVFSIVIPQVELPAIAAA